MPEKQRGTATEIATQVVKTKSASWLIGLLAPFWVPILLVLLAFMFMAFSLANDNSTSACAAEANSNGSNNTQIAYNYLVTHPELDLKPFQAAAIVGNFIHESGGDPIKTDNPNQSSGAIGIAHWLGGRQDSLKAHKFQSRHWTDIYFQLDFLRYELTSYERGSLEAVQRTTDIREATEVFEAKFERSGVVSSYPVRTALAISVYDRYAGSSSVNVASSCVVEGVDGSLKDPGLGPQNPSQYNLVPRAYNLRQVILNRWGCEQTNRQPCIREIGGYAQRPAGTPQDHSLGLALDITISDNIGAYPNSSQLALGWEISCFIVANAEGLGVKYQIWQGLIWNVDRTSEGGPGKCTGSKTGWRPYTSGYGVTAGHYDHNHTTVQPGVGG